MNNNDLMVPMLGFMCVLVVVLLVIVAFYLATLQRTLARCSPENRTMEPGTVWLNLIPLFNLYWGFHTAIQIGNSLKNEFQDRGIDDGSDYGKSLGIGVMILQIASNVFSNVGEVVDGGGFGPMTIASLAIVLLAFGLFIVYWVRIYGYGSRLRLDDERRGDFDDDPDDDGYSPRRPIDPQSTDITARERDDRYR